MQNIEPTAPENSHTDENTVAVNGAHSAVDDIVEISGSLQGLSPERLEQRRHALLSMLRTSVQRYEMVKRHRRPPFAAGLRVQAHSGVHVGLTGLIEDADYIQQRALVRSDSDYDEEQLWLPFHQLVVLQD